MKKIKLKQKMKTVIDALNKFGNIVSIPLSLKIIFAIVVSVGSIVGFWFLHIFHKFWDLLTQLYQSPIWSTPITPKLWQVLLLVLIVPLTYFYSKKIIMKYKFNKSLIEFKNFKWRIAKDFFDNIIIEQLPYCLTHNKKISRGDNRNYLHCFDCRAIYNFNDINKLCINVKKFIKEKYGLDYMPKLY